VGLSSRKSTTSPKSRLETTQGRAFHAAHMNGVWHESKYDSEEESFTSDDDFPSQPVEPRIVAVKPLGVTKHSTAAEIRASFDAQDWGERGVKRRCLVQGCTSQFKAHGASRETRLQRQLGGLRGHCVGLKHDDAHQHLAAELDAQLLVPAVQYSETQWVAYIAHCRWLRQKLPWCMSTQDQKTLQVYNRKLQQGCFKASDEYYKAWDEALEL
jgi:hypothetical protein